MNQGHHSFSDAEMMKMNDYYNSQFGIDGHGQQNHDGQGGNIMDMMDQSPMSPSGIVGGQSLEDIVSQNSKDMRRRSMPVHYAPGGTGLENDLRRVSMMEFNGASPGGPLDSFQFDPSSSSSPNNVMRGPSAPHMPGRRGSQVRKSVGDLALNSNVMNSPYHDLNSATSAYQSPMRSTPIDVNGNNNNFMQTPITLDMDMSSLMPDAVDPMQMYTQADLASPMLSTPGHASMNDSMRGPSQDPGGGMSLDVRDQFVHSSKGSSTGRSHSMGATSQAPSASHSVIQHTSSTPHSQSTRTPHSVPQTSHSSVAQRPQMQQNNSSSMSGQKFPWPEPPGGWPSTMHGRPHMESQYKNAYSSTGFDMLGVLMRVATRPNPEINIGSVDLSCAFVVCDAELDDFPIVYCSENFERLTGYNKHMILGRNCRFLQSPDGNVSAGVKRKYVDDDSVLYLKNMINTRREAQISLINYRRGGQPFMNLLTMIPITWDTDTIKFFVGFQVDLVEQPNAVTNKNPDGSYSINYQRSMGMPSYTLQAPEVQQSSEFGQTITRDDVSAVLSTLGTGESELYKRIWDKVLLENTDDVIHVLSLKGLFLYLSPSSRKILEYDATELVGTALSSVCHPSDIVPVTRELKDTSSGASVNVVFRIRRKYSGYMWFEGHGSLHTEQGKGRKCIILVGRERPVYTLSKSDIASTGGIGDNELWTKMSTSGFFLFVSTQVRQLLDRQPDELIGVSIQSLMRPDSKQEFGRILELARSGKKASVRHEMINKRGQVLQAFTTLYPGDAGEGSKPTFVVAQTRLIKFSRNNSSTQRPPIYPKGEREVSASSISGVSTSPAGPGPTSGGLAPISESTPQSNSSMRFKSTEGAPITYAGQNGLVIGNQDVALASEENVFDELKTTRSTSWQFELRQMEKRNRLLAEEVQGLLAAKKKRKRRKGAGQLQKDCANCHTRVTPEWRRGPSGNRDLCNSCGLRWAKLNGRVSPRTTSQHSAHSQSDKASGSPLNSAKQNPKSGHSSEQKHDGGSTSPHTSNNRGSQPEPTPMSTSSTTKSPPNAGHQQHAPIDHHAPKVPKVDNSSSHAHVGVPPKIEEGIEPPDEA